MAKTEHWMLARMLSNWKSHVLQVGIYCEATLENCMYESANKQTYRSINLA